MDASKYVKPTYSFREIMELQKLPLTDKVAISCEALRRAFRRHKPHHRMALAFSGGKDSQVVSDLIERYFPDMHARMYCIFGNTGIEFPESLRFAREYGREHYGDRFGDRKSLLEDRPCAYDEYGELVDLTGTGLDAEYDAEVLVTPEGQLRLI